MAQLPIRVRNLVFGGAGRYRVVRTSANGDLKADIAAAHLPAAKVIATQLVRSGKRLMLACHPADRSLDLTVLERHFQGRFELCAPRTCRKLLQGCDPSALPPFGHLYDLSVVVDARLQQPQGLYFPPGIGGAFIYTDQQQLQRLLGKVELIPNLSRGKPPKRRLGMDPTQSRRKMLDKIRRVERLPSMPGIAQELLPLRNDPGVSTARLASIIEQDPSLAAQVIRYATSPLYGYAGKVDSIHTAIARVLGMEFVFDLAFGLSLGRGLRLPNEGPLGLYPFWRHAVFSAALTHDLSQQIGIEESHHGTAYLAGLLHNFGLLVLGHCFPVEFKRLNQLQAKYPRRPLVTIERATMGVTHTELGQWLMRHWRMPPVLVEAVRHHHDPDFRSLEGPYTNLVWLANQLLLPSKLGDAERQQIPSAMLEQLGLSGDQLQDALSRIATDQENLNAIARGLVTTRAA